MRCDAVDALLRVRYEYEVHTSSSPSFLHVERKSLVRNGNARGRPPARLDRFVAFFSSSSILTLNPDVPQSNTHRRLSPPSRNCNEHDRRGPTCIVVAAAGSSIQRRPIPTPTATPIPAAINLNLIVIRTGRLLLKGSLSLTCSGPTRSFGPSVVSCVEPARTAFGDVFDGSRCASVCLCFVVGGCSQ